MLKDPTLLQLYQAGFIGFQYTCWQCMAQPAFAAIKANRVEDIRLRYEKNYKLKNENFLDCWFSQPVQELLNKAAQKF